MSKKVTWTLFIILFATSFTLFQFESDSRRQRALLESKIRELELQLRTYIQQTENDTTRKDLTQVNVTQQHLADRFIEDKKKVTELLEILIAKDEKFARELQQVKQEIETVRIKAGVPVDDR